MKAKIITISCAILTMTACASHQSAKNTHTNKEEATLAFMNPNDKKMSCKELQLEMNEAEFFSKTALDDTNMGFSSVFSPVKSYHNYSKAQKTIENSQVRIEYLNQIYNILNCNGRLGVKGANVEVPHGAMGAQPVSVRDYPEHAQTRQVAQEPYALEEPTVMLPNEEDDYNSDDDDQI